MKKTLLCASLLLSCTTVPYVYAADTATTGTTSTTTSTTTTTTTTPTTNATTCPTPSTTTTTASTTTSTAKAAASNCTPTSKPRPSIDVGQHCSGGGTRTVEGGLDATTGVIDLTTTLTACKTRNGQVYDGKTSTTGTIKADATSIAIDTKTVVDMKMTRSDGTSVTRTCTVTKVGTFTHKTQTFDGTTTRTDCQVTGAVRDHEGVVEHLLRSATTDDETGGDDPLSRLLPEQAGEDKGSSGRR